MLSGAVTSTQLEASLAALTVGQLPALRLAEPPGCLLGDPGRQAVALRPLTRYGARPS